MKKSAALAYVILCVLALSPLCAQETKSPDSPASMAKTLRDARTGIIYYLESDGHHVSAIAPKGTLLWTRDFLYKPEPGSHLYGRSQITDFSLVDPKRWYYQKQYGDDDQYLQVGFGMAFGLIRKRTGEFIFQGQD